MGLFRNPCPTQSDPELKGAHIWEFAKAALKSILKRIRIKCLHNYQNHKYVSQSLLSLFKFHSTDKCEMICHSFDVGYEDFTIYYEHFVNKIRAHVTGAHRDLYDSLSTNECKYRYLKMRIWTSHIWNIVVQHLLSTGTMFCAPSIRSITFPFDKTVSKTSLSLNYKWISCIGC